MQRTLSAIASGRLKNHLRRGGLIAYPTESCYGLGCLPTHTKALKKLIRLKRRPQHKGMIVIGDTLDRLRTLSALTSLRATWPEGSDYEPLISAARTNADATSKKQAQGVEFIVNDNTVYYSERDFRSADAAEAFEKAATLRKQAEVIEERLRDAYAAYEKSSKADRAQLRAAIRTDERTLDDLRVQIKSWEKRARNAENRTIIK